MKRSICLLLSVLMALSIALPTTVFADDEFIDEVELSYEQEYYEEELIDDTWTASEPEEVILDDETNVIVVDQTGDSVEDEYSVVVEESGADEVATIEEEPSDVLEAQAVEEDNASDDAEMEIAETFAAGDFTITAPENVTVEAGKTATFHVTVTGGTAPYTFTWQVQRAGATAWQTTTLNGYDTDTLSFKAVTTYNGRHYRCIVTDANGTRKESDGALLTIGKVEPLAVTAPENVTVEAGKTATFHVSATGGTAPYTFTWQVQRAGATAWQTTTLNGYDTDTLSFKAVTTYNGRHYRCVVTDAAGTQKESDGALLTIGKVEPIKITGPDSKTANVGESVSFHVDVTGGSGTYTYRWEVLPNGEETWQEATQTGHDTDTLSLTATSEISGQKFHCVVMDSSGMTDTSADALLTVGEIEPLAVTAPENVTVEAGKTATFHVTATGGTAPYTFKWQVQKAGATAWQSTTLDGYDTDTLSFKAVTTYNGRHYRCIVTDANGTRKESDGALLTIGIEPTEKVIDDVVYAKLSSEAWYVKKYQGTASTLAILAEIDGLPVEEIGVEAFMGNLTLESIDLPDSIKVIRARAFMNCTNLREMR